MSRENISDKMLALYEAGTTSSELGRQFDLEIFEVHRRLYAARKRRRIAAAQETVVLS